jgi:hypothetical protein
MWEQILDAAMDLPPEGTTAPAWTIGDAAGITDLGSTATSRQEQILAVASGEGLDALSGRGHCGDHRISRTRLDGRSALRGWVLGPGIVGGVQWKHPAPALPVVDGERLPVEVGACSPTARLSDGEAR